MSTQHTSADAIQYVHDIFYRLMWAGMRTNENNHLKYEVEKLHYNEHSLDQLFYSMRLIQTMNARAFNIRYKDTPEWLSSLSPCDKVKRKPRRDKDKAPTRAEIMPVFRLLDHSIYNLDGHEAATETAEKLREILADYIIRTDADYKKCEWGVIDY